MQYRVQNKTYEGSLPELFSLFLVKSFICTNLVSKRLLGHKNNTTMHYLEQYVFGRYICAGQQSSVGLPLFYT